MTALVPREVERTFSGVGGLLTGLPPRKTHEAGRQNVGEFAQSRFGIGMLQRHLHNGRLDEKF